jgi:cytochrome c553
MTSTASASKGWRPLALGLAAAIFCQLPAVAQNGGLAERIRMCADCHGEDGNSRSSNIPSLAGQPAFFLLSQMVFMREGVRDAQAMAPLLKGLKDEELEQLASYFAALPSKASDESIDPVLVKRGAEIAAARRCGSCHLPNLSGHQQIPRIARQRIDYTIGALKSYRDSLRPGADTAMSANIVGTTDADIAALAHYAASL